MALLEKCTKIHRNVCGMKFQELTFHLKITMVTSSDIKYMRNTSYDTLNFICFFCFVICSNFTMANNI